MSNDPRDPTGVAMYERIFGKKAPSPEGLNGIKELALNHLFAKIWTREGLSIRDRRLVTIALLAAQGRPDQLRDHIRGARLGEDALSEEEIRELMVHVAHYAGWAAGTNGQGIASAVFSELES
ncbi:MAG TPA: carboxymuconolactone decarboxylase family protein [Vicinamibacteria bacterium]|jgi:4-carboxymuconolactone decarboxylase